MTGSSNKNTATIIPTLRYRDAAKAIDWLCEAFGFQRHLVVQEEDGSIAHAQLVFGNGMIMLGSAEDDDFGKLQQPLATPDTPVSQSPYVIVADVDAPCHIRRRRRSGRSGSKGRGLRRTGLFLPRSGR